LDDKTIISECQKGNPKYQKLLLEKYSDYLASAARNYMSDKESIMDVLQDTWIIIFKNIKNYEEKGYFYAWAKRIMLREIIRMSKKEKAKVLFLNTLGRKNNMIQPDIERKLELQEAMKLIENIPSPAREVFKMFVVEGLPHKEIAQMMGIKESTSRVHLTNARKKLRQFLSKLDQRKVKL